MFVGVGKVIVGVVEGIVVFVVGFYGFCCGKEYGIRVMAVFYSSYFMVFF